MKLEKKHYYWVGAAALITVIGVVVYKNRKNKKIKSSKNSIKPKSIVGENTSIDSLVENSVSPFPIKMGAKGDSVKAIQKYINSTCPSDLKSVGIYPLEINGVWDDKTDEAALACSVLKRNEIDKESFDRILRDLQSANITI